MVLTLQVELGWDVRHGDLPPVSYVETGQWPHAELRAEAPPSAHLAQAVAAALEVAMDQRKLSARAVARLIGATHPTVNRLLDGSGLTDARTVFILEVALQAPLWPRELYRKLAVDVAPESGAT